MSITLAPIAGGVAVTIANSGVTRPATPATPGLGLASMHERVRIAGGTLRIDRASDGWTILARFGLTNADGTH